MCKRDKNVYQKQKVHKISNKELLIKAKKVKMLFRSGCCILVLCVDEITNEMVCVLQLFILVPCSVNDTARSRKEQYDL